MHYQISDNSIQASRQFFKSSSYAVIRLIAGICTVIVLLGYPYLPVRMVPLIPDPHFQYGPYGGSGNAQWVTENVHKFSCDYKQGEVYSCGLSLSVTKDGTKGLNIEDFEGLIIHAKYTGASNRFRISMRNHNPVYSADDPALKSKYMLTFVRTADFDTSAFIKLSEFSVAEWWTRQYDVPRINAAPEFSNIISISVDFVDFGQQELEISKVELIGSWISKEKLYLIILLLWMFFIIGDGTIRFILIYIESQRANQKINEMTESYRQLETAKNEFEVLSVTDKLTGITNRTGIDNFVKKKILGRSKTTQFGIIIVDIDYFKKINDERGHNAGDRVLQQLAQVVLTNTRTVDLFGRWGGEEFIIITPQVELENLTILAEKLRVRIASHSFETPEPLNLTVSMGITMVKPGDSFEDAFKRADIALYNAKSRGRNCVVPSA